MIQVKLTTFGCDRQVPSPTASCLLLLERFGRAKWTRYIIYAQQLLTRNTARCRT